ncbi:hypothetical protein Acsp02_68470 [Actinoplanes sp. NBRC 103695]|nr:hypothetical protein Acsp02_68470 [Actinoplanes sp. NBRC 103695]
MLYVESLSRFAAMAVPKYRPDWAAAAPRVLAAALAAGIANPMPAAARTTAATPSSGRKGKRELIATMASFLGSGPGHPLHAGRGIEPPCG